MAPGKFTLVEVTEAEHYDLKARVLNTEASMKLR
jgi:hypothetical protein